MIKLETLEGVLLMQKCPVCDHMNRLGELICQKCGANLQTGTPSVNMESVQPKGAAPTQAEEKPTQPASVTTPPPSSDKPIEASSTTLATSQDPEAKSAAPSPAEAPKSEAAAPSPATSAEAEKAPVVEPTAPKAEAPAITKAETTTKRIIPEELKAELGEEPKAKAASAQVECPNCHHLNRPGEIFCESCGANLKTGQKAASTKALPTEERLQYDTPYEEPSAQRGTDLFPSGGALRLQIEGSSEPILLPFHQQEIVLGRRDPATGALPDVDLTPFAGYRMGVSRRHSQIKRSNDGHLELFDLGSSNGTFLNGERLEAHYPYRLRDGDKIALGQISIHVHFERSMTSQKQA